MSEEKIVSAIWSEQAEPDNPFAASVCYCNGYDVYGDLLSKASWIEYLYLLFVGERPSQAQANLLEGLAIALANPGLRDHSVRAAMSGGVGGSTSASCLMAALAIGSGSLGGSREIVVALGCWQQCGMDLVLWKDCLTESIEDERIDLWPTMEHPPGFDPHGASCATPVRQVLKHLAQLSDGTYLPWLEKNRELLEEHADCPLALSGVAAAAFADLGLGAEKAEMLYLILRLPGAAVHALEQTHNGWRKYPFFRDAVVLTDDPLNNANMNRREGDLK